MIWHIFRKDWKLLRWYVIGLVLINLFTHIARDHMSGQLRPMGESGGVFALFGTALLVTMLVQKDAIPGLRQDWLTRPIKRTDLLLSKLAFVVLLVQAPVFLIEVGQGIAAGFPLGQIVGACLSRSIWVFLALELPVFAFATLTRNLMEAVGVTVGVGAVLTFSFVTTLTLRSGRHIDGSQLAWVAGTLQVLWVLLCAGVVVAIQYYRRKTVSSRWLSGVAIAGWVLAYAVSWQTAFAVQQKFSPHPEAADAIRVDVDTSVHPRSYSISARGSVMAELVLKVDGVRQDDMLVTENVTGRIRQQDGRVTELGFQPPRPLSHGGTQQVILPENLYHLVKDHPVRLELDYDLTLSKGDPLRGMSALNGDQWLPGVGSCTTTPDEVYGYAKLDCVTMGEAPCAIWFIENLRPEPQDQQRGCVRNYSPWFERVNGDSMTHFGGDIYFSDIRKSVQFPVDLKEMKQARVMIRVFHPQAHFTRHVVVSGIRLSEWSLEK